MILEFWVFSSHTCWEVRVNKLAAHRLVMLAAVMTFLINNCCY